MKKLIVNYNGDPVKGADNSQVYKNAIAKIGADRVCELGIKHSKIVDGKTYETEIVVKLPAVCQEKYTWNKFDGSGYNDYRVIYLKDEENEARLRYLLEIKERLQLSDEEFTAELV